MSTAKPAKVRFPEVVLHVKLDPPSGAEGYCHVTGWFSRRRDVGDYTTLYASDLGGHLNGVNFTSQCDSKRLADPSNSFPFYAIHIEWSDSHTDLYSLRRGVASLAKIDTAMDKVSARYGQPQSIGQWVLRVADACGIGTIDLFTANDGGSHKERSPADAAWMIDNRVFDWRTLARKIHGIPDVA